MGTFPTDDLRSRTKAFALQIVRLSQLLAKGPGARIIGNRLLRSGASVAANYRRACRAQSRAALVSKLGIVVEEAGLVSHEDLTSIVSEARGTSRNLLSLSAHDKGSQILNPRRFHDAGYFIKSRDHQIIL
ncbi:MAG: four helix bundle protein [Nitrospiraceae bacterium]|nr:four helix bundle protein [Nitrospiraceae bacterium]